jgi:hypothetical protein
MRGLRLSGTGLVTALALMLVILPASDALAKSLPLQLEESGVPVPVGAPAHTILAISSCFVSSEGVMAVNGAKTDELTAASSAPAECSEGESASGTLTSTQISAKGKIKMVGTITLTKPGPCTYEFKKWKATLTIPGETLWESAASGKLAKGSSPSCGKKITESYVAGVVGGELLQAVLG